MESNIIIDVARQSTRVALLENMELVELYIESVNNQNIVGNIYNGRVINVLPGMEAVFIDIGYKKNAFLHTQDTLKEGQSIIVQVIKQCIGSKGPKVTTNISLPGRYHVLLSNTNCIGISKKIIDKKEKQRLENIAQVIKPENMGLIIRTEAWGRDEDELTEHLNTLIKKYEKVKSVKTLGKPPQLLHEDSSLIFRSIRELLTCSTQKLLINNRKQYKLILENLNVIAPELKCKVEYFNKSRDIFEYYKIEQQIQKTLDKKVWLKNGGYIVIEKTEALTAIDVNTGKYIGNRNLESTVSDTNVEAAKEIAKQLRLRDIGGIIIIDFIDMHIDENKEKVIEVLNHYLKNDKSKSNVLGITKLGLIEMTRKKVRKDLPTLLTNDR